jgi:hypothetical protein
VTPSLGRRRQAVRRARSWRPAIDAQLIASSGRIAPPPPAEAVAPQARPDDHGFDWGSAAIGAGVAGGITLVAAGRLGAAHRTRTRPAR